jgi:hypothetical protein
MSGVPAGSGAGATGADGGLAARSCVSRGEGGREAGRWAIQRRGAAGGGEGGYDRWAQDGKMKKKKRKQKSI